MPTDDAFNDEDRDLFLKQVNFQAANVNFLLPFRKPLSVPVQYKHQHTRYHRVGGEWMPLRQGKQADETEYHHEYIQVTEVRVFDEAMQSFHGCFIVLQVQCGYLRLRSHAADFHAYFAR